MLDPKVIVKNSEKLTSLFRGSWPEFHDAEIVDLHLWRGNVRPGNWDDRNVFPVLTVKVRILEATQPGASHAGDDVLATLRFHDFSELKLKGFDHMNQILSLSITQRDRGKGPKGNSLQPDYVVDFESFGSFSCFQIEVLDAVPFKEE